MQKKTKLMIAGATAGLVALGGLAGLANAHMHGGKGGHMGMMARQMMERYDADKDGKLSQEEIDQNRGSWHGEFDGDKNATLSLDEFKSLWLKAKQDVMVREFQSFDRDGNGQVTLDEYKQPMASMVTDMDKNGDGVLSRDDRPKHGERMRDDRKGKDKGMMEQAPAEAEGAAPPPAPANP